MPHGELPGDIAAHGQSTKKDWLVYFQRVENSGDIVGHLFHRRCARSDATASKPPQVWHDHSAGVRKPLNLPLPHRMIERVAVDEHERQAAAPLDDVELNSCA